MIMYILTFEKTYFAVFFYEWDAFNIILINSEIIFLHGQISLSDGLAFVFNLD